MFLFWGIVIAIGLLNRAVMTLRRIIVSDDRDWKSAPNEGLGEDGPPDDRNTRPRRTRFPTWLKRHVTLPATFGHRSSQPFGWYTVPPRIQSITIAAFVIMNVVFCVHGYHVFPGNL